MDERLKEKIKQFVLQEVNETKVSAVSDSFWQGLKNTGTELWLDTGDMEEAEKTGRPK